jgi:hypothetical protein
MYTYIFEAFNLKFLCDYLSFIHLTNLLINFLSLIHGPHKMLVKIKIIPKLIAVDVSVMDKHEDIYIYIYIYS